MKKIYVADDDKNIRDIISSFLINSGYEVESFSSGTDLKERFDVLEPDMIILDIMMDGIDGLSICTSIREKSNIPIIIVSAKDTEMDRILGITLGADDYLVKPFSPIELVARINGIFRRFESIASSKESTKLSFGNIEIDLNLKKCTCNNDDFSVTPTEFALLTYMFQNSERAVSREELLLNVWNFSYDVDTKACDDVLKRLRKKLIKTNVRVISVWGFGFKLEMEV